MIMIPLINQRSSLIVKQLLEDNENNVRVVKENQIMFPKSIKDLEKSSSKFHTL